MMNHVPPNIAATAAATVARAPVTTQRRYGCGASIREWKRILASSTSTFSSAISRTSA